MVVLVRLIDEVVVAVVNGIEYGIYISFDNEQFFFFVGGVCVCVWKHMQMHKANTYEKWQHMERLGRPS